MGKKKTKRFVCPHCKMRTATYYQLKTHITWKHPEKLNFPARDDAYNEEIESTENRPQPQQEAQDPGAKPEPERPQGLKPYKPGQKLEQDKEEKKSNDDDWSLF